MSAAVECVSVVRVMRCWAALLLMSVLAGCATTSGSRAPSNWDQGGPRFSAPSSPAPAPRILLAMSDGPTEGGVPSSPAVQGYNVPGRKPDSQVPWAFFLGNAAHRLIAYIYGVNHPGNRVLYNKETLFGILSRVDSSEPSRLHPDERNLRPDITDISSRSLFEIKPWSEQALQEGRQEARIYLAALNRTLLVGRPFTGGTGFHGEILIRFAGGQHIWRLEWKTSEPGVVQYQWTRSQQRFESQAAAYAAAQWVDLTEQEMRQYGGAVAQAVEGTVSRREKLATVSGAVGIVIDIIGNATTGFFSGAILGRMGSGTGAQEPPAQGGGQVIPFPQPPPTSPPAQVPAAAGMSLPR